MQRLCFTFDIYEGAAAEYKKRHDEIWPELVAAIKDAGFSNYTLFRRGTQVIGYAEIEPDVETAMATLGQSEHNARWGRWFEELIVNLTDGRGQLMTCDEVWHLD